MMESFRIAFVLMTSLMVISNPCVAMYKCVIDGKTVFQQFQCQSESERFLFEQNRRKSNFSKSNKMLLEQPQSLRIIESDKAKWKQVLGKMQRSIRQKHFERSIVFAKEALIYAKQHFGERHPDTLTSMFFLPVVYILQGQHAKADPLIAKALDLMTETLGKKHPTTLESMSDTAGMYKTQGHFAKAEPLWVKTLALRKEVLGEKHPKTLTNMGNLAALYESQGHYAKAEPLWVKTLALRKEVLGEKHADTLINMNNLALLYYSRGHYAKAEPLWVKTLALKKEVLGEKHADTLISMNNLAALYKSQGHYAKAEHLYAKTLALSKEVLGEKHPFTLTSMNNLAGLYISQSRYAKAEHLYVKTLALMKEVLGEKHPSTLTNMGDLAVLYLAQGRYDKAEHFCVKTLALIKNVLGEKHLNTLIIMNTLASAYDYQGRYNKAEPLFIKALALKKEILGEKHPSTLENMYTLAYMYYHQGRYDKAEPLFAKTLALMKERLGATHPNTFSAMNNLALLYQSQGRYSKATSLFVETLTLMEDVMGEKHHFTLMSLGNLATVYLLRGKYSKAEPLLVRALTLRKEVLSEKHPSTLTSMNNLAFLYKSQGRYAKAEPLFRKTLTLMKEILGGKHPDTLNTMFNLVLLYIDMKKYPKAEKLGMKMIESTNQFLGKILWGAGEKTRISYIKQQKVRNNIYLSLVNERNHKNNASEALNFSLARKGLLLQISSQVKALSRGSSNPRLRNQATKLEALKKKLTGLVLSGKGKNEDIQSIENSINHLEAQLGQHIKQLQRGSMKVVPKQVVAVLKDKEALLDFLVFERYDFTKQKFKETHVLALVVNNTQSPPIRLIPMGKLKPIESQIKSYRRALSKPRAITLSQDKLAKGKRLYKTLWKPLLPYLKGKTTVYLSPDGVLNLLPFSTLIDPQGKYLLETINIKVISSARDIVLPPIEAKATPPIIFSSPLYDPAQADKYVELAYQTGRTTGRSFNDLHFNPLPGALQEGLLVDKLMKQSRLDAKYFLLATATETKMRTVKSPRILHLATHGFFLDDLVVEQKDLNAEKRGLIRVESTPAQTPKYRNVENPLLRSGLAFADANLGLKGEIQADGTDGILTAEEVLSLDLAGTDLVVLSACETGMGDVVQGEGVYGLRRAFQEAGAKSVMSTLWAISDEGTQEFMRRFYSLFLAKMPAQKALRKTKLEFIRSEKWQHPFYWAPFVIVGAN